MSLYMCIFGIKILEVVVSLFSISDEETSSKIAIIYFWGENTIDEAFLLYWGEMGKSKLTL